MIANTRWGKTNWGKFFSVAFKTATAEYYPTKVSVNEILIWNFVFFLTGKVMLTCMPQIINLFIYPFLPRIKTRLQELLHINGSVSTSRYQICNLPQNQQKIRIWIPHFLGLWVAELLLDSVLHYVYFLVNRCCIIVLLSVDQENTFDSVAIHMLMTEL